MKESLVKKSKEEEKDMDTKEKENLISNVEEKAVKKEKNIEKEEKKNNKEGKKTERDISKEEKTKFNKSNESPKKLEKDIKDMENKKSKKKYIVLASIIGIIIIIAIVISTVFALMNINNEKIISGISISGIDVSGLSKEEAKGKMEALYNEKKEKEIDLKYQDYETTLNPALMEVNYNVEKAVDDAYTVGRKENIFISNYDILFTLLAKKNINVEMSLNEEVTKQSIDDIGVNLPGIVIESSYSVEEDELIITKGKAGISIDTDKLFEEVKCKLEDVNANEDLIEIPIFNKEPEKIDIDKIHDEVYKEAKDAYFTKEPFAIYPEVEGVDFDVEAARALLEEEKDEYVIKLKITKPSITIDKIGSEAFHDQLATFTTRYDVSDVDRSTNLRIACEKINGKVVLVGDTFSYNKALGARTVAAGYKNGKIYAGGEVVDGIGGGICQISSTLYNSVLLANLEIVERRNHQFVTSYVGPGRDATVVYGLTDFKFKNTRKYPIRISASAQNGIATVSIYGIKEENEYTFKFSTKTIASIPFTTKYIEDATLSAGTEKVKQKGTNGLKTETYITKMQNGKAISTTLLSRDTYDAMQRIVLKGTKASETIQETPVTTTETQTPSTQTPTEEIPKESEPIENTESETETTNPDSEQAVEN